MSLLALGVASCLCMAFGPPMLVNSDLPQRPLTPYQIRLMRQAPQPELTAPSSLLADVTTRRVLYARQENERRAVGSLVKIVTAMVALERAPLDKDLRVHQDDMVVSSAANLQNGELLSLREYLFFLLIPSDNRAAVTIARGLGKETSTYIGWMNEWVARLGLVDTRFANSSGLDHRAAYSTAHDMAVITLEAMKNPVFADIVRRPEVAIAARRLESTNKLLNVYPGMIGVKTGTEERAGECLITIVDRTQGKVISVVLGSTDRFRDTRLLLDYYYANYAQLRIDIPQTALNRYQDEDGNWHEFGLREPAIYLVSPWQMGTVSLYRRIDNPTPSPNPQEPVGALVVDLAGQPFAELPLYAR
jgi:D-alanyl-D-alanine carboxypeptidase (penicillin-binding protein 5/6)